MSARLSQPKTDDEYKAVFAEAGLSDVDIALLFLALSALDVRAISAPRREAVLGITARAVLLKAVGSAVQTDIEGAARGRASLAINTSKRFFDFENLLRKVELFQSVQADTVLDYMLNWFTSDSRKHSEEFVGLPIQSAF